MIYAVLEVVAVRGHDVRLFATVPPEGLLPAGSHFTTSVPQGVTELLQVSDRCLPFLKPGASFVVQFTPIEDFHEAVVGTPQQLPETAQSTGSGGFGMGY